MDYDAKGFLREFKEFISRGNVLDMAVGIIVGAAFTSIVNSLVNDIVMPLVGYIIHGINFSDIKLVLAPPQGDTPEVAILYGSFFQQIVVFLITAMSVFLLMKILGSIRHKKEAAEAEAPPAPPEPPQEAVLLAEIRDLLREQRDRAE